MEHQLLFKKSILRRKNYTSETFQTILNNLSRDGEKRCSNDKNKWQIGTTEHFYKINHHESKIMVNSGKIYLFLTIL